MNILIIKDPMIQTYTTPNKAQANISNHNLGMIDPRTPSAPPNMRHTTLLKTGVTHDTTKTTIHSSKAGSNTELPMIIIIKISQLRATIPISKICDIKKKKVKDMGHRIMPSKGIKVDQKKVTGLMRKICMVGTPQAIEFRTQSSLT
jgi:hypothetical protein